MSVTHGELSDRARAILRAVAAHRVTMTTSCEPDLFIDGFACCDQVTAHNLSRAGYVRPVGISAVGTRVRAELTATGQTAIAVSLAA